LIAYFSFKRFFWSAFWESTVLWSIECQINSPKYVLAEQLYGYIKGFYEMAEEKISRDSILAALSKVQEPELHKDLVTLNMIQDLAIKETKVNFTIVLTTPACPLRGKIEKEARQAVLGVPGVQSVEIKMDANVPSDGRPRGTLELKVKNAIAVASGKGGVGKSTVAVNIAVALAKTGASVGLLDADIYGPNVPTMMGVDRLPPPRNNKLVPAETYGVKMMSIGFLVKPGQPLIWRGPMLHSAIRQFLADVDWGELDYLVVDLPPGTGDAQLSLAQSLPLSGGIIVTLPQQVSLEDASRGLYMFKELNVPILGVVENMSYLELPDGTRMEVFGRGGGQQLATSAGVPFIGLIPMDPEVRIGGDSGKPIVVSHPESKTAQALTAIAMDVAARLSVLAFEGGSGIQISMIG
jgi:ATP-binding protein involved in chromosome partitioning